ncbi:hypothetical protein Ancab_015876 [Ancistrocladus abbreviatus]
MEKHQQIHAWIFSIIVSLGVISFICCIVAEFKKSKEEDVRLVGRMCYLPGSEAFGFGVAGLVCLLSAEMMGSFLICRSSLSAGKKPKVSTFLLAFSWLSLGIDLLLLSTATDMNRRQLYDKGWLNGDCYVVKDGIFLCSGLLVVVTLGSLLISTSMILRQVHDENIQGNKDTNKRNIS